MSFPKVGPEARIQGQVVHLGGEARKGSGEVRQGGKKASTASIEEEVTAVGIWDSIPPGTSGKLPRPPQGCPT